MHNKKLFSSLWVALALLFAACHTQYQPARLEPKTIKVDKKEAQANEEAVQLIAPYKKSLDSLMNVKLAVAGEEFKKESPEGSMGNLVCDELMEYAKAKGYAPHLCVMNNGGLRIPVIYKGEVSVRTVYELMPFENRLLLIKISAEKFQLLTKAIAEAGGVPLSGIRMEIQNKAVASLSIQGKEWSSDQSYWILTSDYLANGGDNSEALKNPLEVIDLNILIRDALIARFKLAGEANKPLMPIIDGRVTKK